MGISEVRRKAEFEEFQSRVEEISEWSSPFAEALSLTMVDKGVSHGELARLMRMDHGNIRKCDRALASSLNATCRSSRCYFRVRLQLRNFPFFYKRLPGLIFGTG